VDVAWLRSPLAYLADVLEYFPCALQTEALPIFPPMFCLGFCALTDASACLEIIDHFIARYAEDGARPLQPVFRDMLIENPRFLANIFPLPEGLFPNGLLYRATESSKEPPLAMSGQLQPFIFHSNWARGLEKKRRLLTHSRLWFVPENNGSIGLGEPIPLFSITNFVVHKDAQVLLGQGFQIITPQEQWSYALSFTIDSDALQLLCSDQTITLNIQLRVDEGSAGIGILKDSGREFIVEKVIPPAKDYRIITLRAPVSEKISEIIIRNCWDSGNPSRISVQSIESRLSRRYNFSI
jgi:hypothetical protein